MATLATGFPAGTPSARSTGWRGAYSRSNDRAKQNEPWEVNHGTFLFRKVPPMPINANREALKPAAVNFYDGIMSLSNFINDIHRMSDE